MRIRDFATLGMLTATVTLGMAATASAAPFLLGTANSTGNHAIFRYDIATNTHVTILDTTTDVPGCSFANFCTPDSLVIDSSGRVIYTMENKGEIHRFTPGVPGSDVILASGFVEPKDLTLAPDGLSVYVSDTNEGGAPGHKIANVLNCAAPPCAPVTFLGGGSGTLYATVDGPHGLAFVPGDTTHIYANVGDRFGGSANSHLAQILLSTGAVTAQTGTLNSLDGLSFDKDPLHPFLYATSNGGDLVYQFNPLNLAGGPTATLFAGQFPGVAVDGLTYDLAGNLYIAGFSTNASAARLFRCNINTNSCTGLENILGIDDLAPFDQANQATPEPASLLLLGTGLLGIVNYRRFRRR